MKKMVVIDGNSLLHRAFYALPVTLTTKQGIPTNAVLGFLNMLLRMVKERRPDYLAVAFDKKGPTFRHLDFAEYKAGRKPTPDELHPQFPVLKEILEQMGVAILECDGYEADDILGAFAQIGKLQGIAVDLVTGDRDALQLVSDTTHVILTKKGISETEEFDTALIKERYDLTPQGMIELKGLMGDASDNIPGVPGVGEKTALKLLSMYHTLESVLQNADKIGGKLGEKLQEHSELAIMSKKLATIVPAPLDIAMTTCRFQWPSGHQVKDVLEKYQLYSVLQRIEQGTGQREQTAPVSTKKVSLLPVTTMEGLVQAAEQLSAAKEAAVSLTGGITLADGGAAFELQLGGNLLQSGLDEGLVMETLRPLLENKPLLVFDGKQLAWQASRFGIKIGAFADDLMLMAYSSGLEDCSFEGCCKQYGIEPGGVEVYQPLRDAMLAQLRETQAEALYRDIEMPLMLVLYDMERQGFSVDISALRQLGEQYTERLIQLTEKIYEESGQQFNIASPKQLGAVLFEKLKLPVIKKNKSGYSTDVSVLEELAGRHPVIEDILAHRQLSKLKSTYIDGLLNLVKPDGKIYTTFNQAVTATGRISSTEPNLQNIPVRTDEGREIRRIFIASGNHVLISADYSQIELRILAHISNDQIMIDSFLSEEDIHTRTASEVFGVPLELVTPQMRRAAKAVNFGIVYGISEFGLARNLGIGRVQSREYIKRYFEKYSGVKNYMDQIVETGKAQGYVETLFKRRRYLPELKSPNFNIRQFGQRVALNMPIQGTAADIIKVAMTGVHQRLASMQSRLILQVHDELIVDADPKETEEVREIMRQEMEGVIKMQVPLVVHMKQGKSWFDAD
ncbi:MAG: DNA polymerase I [Christensenellales bacterium]